METTRFNNCPTCNNALKNPEANFCKYCGTSVINYCTDDNCGEDNDNDAYYCEYCGSATILGQIENKS